MKKIACYFSATALIMSLSIACTKETDQPQNNSTETPDVVVPEGTPVVMKVTIPGDMTRVSVNQDTDPDGAILLAWEDTDVIRVINHDDATVAQEFEICEGFTAQAFILMQTLTTFFMGRKAFRMLRPKIILSRYRLGMVLQLTSSTWLVLPVWILIQMLNSHRSGQRLMVAVLRRTVFYVYGFNCLIMWRQ